MNPVALSRDQREAALDAHRVDRARRPGRRRRRGRGRCALDAATRGLSVGLVEARDFASGTSSRSSKLIHGGLRYLEMLDFALVAEALQERGLLITELAPAPGAPGAVPLPAARTGSGSGLRRRRRALYDIMGLLSGNAAASRTTGT